jgi:hypothetical protein
MKRSSFIVIGLLWGTPLWASVPAEITYQGALKQSGAAANGTHTMTFRLTDSSGLTQYWNSGPMTVPVNQGLFSVKLVPTGVNWGAVTPYIEVNVDGQALLPREQVTSTAYALSCGSVAEGSELSGMIAMFAKNCPAGWTRFAALDNRFPLGNAVSGNSGGSSSHSHTLLEGSPLPADGPAVVGVSSHGGSMGAYPGGSANFIVYPTRSQTTTVDQLPPYLTVVYCQKL